MGLKKNEMAGWINEIEGAARSEETIPRFAAEIAPLNSAVLPENKEILLPMGKHFAHPEWQKEMGKWMLWLHKQAIEAAIPKLREMFSV